MAATTIDTSSRLDKQVESSANSLSTTSTWLMIAGGALAFGYAPLLIEHFCNMWMRPHYQFVVFLPVAVGLLWARGVKEIREKTPESEKILVSCHPLIWIPILLIGIGILAFAAYAWSPWLAMASLPITALGSLLLLFGWNGLSAMLPGWIMLFVALPLPGNLDVRLIGGLRELTTHWSSLALDAFGVLHRMNGNVIDIPGISLFVADACTGIHSLFVLTAAALFIGLWNQRTIVHIGLLIISTVGIVLVENISRVSLVTYLCLDNPAFSEGWRHSALGFALFAISLLMILSMDSLIQFMLPIRDWSFLWRFGRPVVEKERVKPVERPLQLYLRRWMMPAYAMLLVVGLIQLTWVPSRAVQVSQMMKSNPIEVEELGEEALPAEIGGWKRTGYKVTHRVLDDPLGEYSQSWTYERGGIPVMISLDYPYLRIHDLTLCYQGIGWTVNKKALEETDSGLPFLSADMSRDLEGHAWLAHSMHSQDGACEVALDEELTVQQMYQKRFVFDRPWFQIQALCSSPKAIDEEVKNDVRVLFSELRSTLLNYCQNQEVN